MGAWTFYIATLGAYYFIYIILTLGLNINYGYAGVLNFAYIVFMAAGAYVAAVVILPAAHPAVTGESYVLGLNLPFVVGLVAGAATAMLLGGLLGLVAFRRVRSDFLAILLVAAATVAYDVVSNFTPLFNGSIGLSGLPEVSSGVFGVGPITYPEFFLVVSAVVALALWWFAERLVRSPLGRAMRCVRDEGDLAESIGKSAFRVRMTAMVIGCGYAGVAGALTVTFVGAMNPSAWQAPETFFVFAAMMIGGRANNWGAAIGALLVGVLFVQLTTLLPGPASQPELVSSLRLVALGVMLIATMWFRPRGLLGERRRMAPATTVGGLE